MSRPQAIAKFPLEPATIAPVAIGEDARVTTGIWVLGDRLWAGQASLAAYESARSQTPVLLVEARSLARRHRYHRQKLVLVGSAMRHFAEELRVAGWPVSYTCSNYE